MPAFASDGTVNCPFPAAWIEFFNADKNQWPANAYRTPDCSASREHSHGSFVAALPDGSFPPVFLWDEISYRVVAKGADGSVVATINRVTADAEFVSVAAPEPAPEPQSEPVIDLAAENEALRRRIAELEAIEALKRTRPRRLPLCRRCQRCVSNTCQNNSTLSARDWIGSTRQRVSPIREVHRSTVCWGC